MALRIRSKKLGSIKRGKFMSVHYIFSYFKEDACRCIAYTRMIKAESVRGLQGTSAQIDRSMKLRVFGVIIRHLAR